MTSVTSAGLPRPPTEQLPRPPGPLRPGLERSAGHVFSPLERRPSSTLQRQLSDFTAEDRPAKRRKVDTKSEGSQAPLVDDGPAPSPAYTSGPESVQTTAQWRWAKPSTVRRWAEGDDEIDEAEAQQGVQSKDKLPEMPPRPWRATQLPRVEEDPKPTHRSRINVPVPNAPDSIDMPSTAPHFVPRKPAGFFPWTGMHPEDSLSETNIKTGFFDKPPQNPEKELNSARVSLYNAFKHKSGVDSLSLLFSLVLDQKSQHGGMSSVSTFKPPPRVTLTEIKRRTWISDLANPGVSLRRLSRTIPQGIRGQALLDQCVESSVPLSRAIWFAKCVCANEIRTLKRKGTAPSIASGTEVKWLKEWTVSVEQFLESNLAANELPDWKPSIQYALRLTTRLYMENLLDRDHYLDWILRSFDSAEAGHAPFWLTVVQIYKVDLSYYRKRGTRLVRSLLKKYQALDDAKGQTPATFMRQRLRAGLRELLVAWPNAFLLPDNWHEAGKIVRSCLDLSNTVERRLLDQLQSMNQKSMGYEKTRFAAAKHPETRVVDILDNVQLPYDLAVLDKKLEQACSDRAILMRNCLGWASTRFRNSRSRVYVVTRLIRRWQRTGQDTDTPILDYLSAYAAGRTTASVASLRKLVAQLSRSDCFPVSRYIQWLMVRGLPRSQDQSIASVDEPMAIHFLQDLSLHKVEAHVMNLRNSVLERAGFDLNAEEVEYQRCKTFIEEQLQHLAGLYDREYLHSCVRELWKQVRLKPVRPPCQAP
jgi:mediator of RNA polymerase II transcription subunit 12, fungi type